MGLLDQIGLNANIKNFFAAGAKESAPKSEGLPPELDLLDFTPLDFVSAGLKPKVRDTTKLSLPSTSRLDGYAPSSESEAPSDPDGDWKDTNWGKELMSQTTARCVTGNAVKTGVGKEGHLTELKEERLQSQSAGDCGIRNALHNQEVADDQDDVFGDLQNEAQKSAFKEMTPSERKDFVAIYRAVSANSPDNAEDIGQTAARSLRVLLMCHGLDDVDDNGSTVLETLGAAASKKLSPKLEGIDKKEALQALVSELAFTTIYQGEGTDTCASATMQSLMASSMPGEYARIATELLFEGEAAVQFGAQMKVSTNELSKTDGRNDFDKVIQGSFAAFARTFPGTGDEYGGRGGGGGSSRGDDKSGGTGLFNNQVREMYYHLTGNGAAVAKVTEANREVLFEDMIAAVQDGLYIPVGIDFDGKKDNFGHAVTVIGMGVQGVTYVDSLDMKKKLMPVNEFKEKMSLDGMVVLPKEYAKGITLVEKPESHPVTDFFANLADRFMGLWGFQKLFEAEEDEGSTGGRGGGGGSSR